MCFPRIEIGAGAVERHGRLLRAYETLRQAASGPSGPVPSTTSTETGLPSEPSSTLVPTTRSVRPGPSAIVSPVRQLGRAALSVGGSAGCPVLELEPVGEWHSVPFRCRLGPNGTLSVPSRYSRLLACDRNRRGKPANLRGSRLWPPAPSFERDAVARPLAAEENLELSN
jgi:hypothetical protein